MAEPFLGEIRLMSFNFAPQGWAQCNGQFLPINQNQGLFSLLGTAFGGNGQTTFALPDLRGRVPIHHGAGYTIGEQAGEQTHTLSLAETPTHTHAVVAQGAAGTTAVPAGAVLASSPAAIYGPATALTTLLPASAGSIGGSQAHTNMQPYLTLNFCIALQGIFPSRN